MDALNAASRQQTTLMVTHQLEGIADHHPDLIPVGNTFQLVSHHQGGLLA